MHILYTVSYLGGGIIFHFFLYCILFKVRNKGFEKVEKLDDGMSNLEYKLHVLQSTRLPILGHTFGLILLTAKI